MNANGGRPSTRVGRADTHDGELTTPNHGGWELKTENSKLNTANWVGGGAAYGADQRPFLATAMVWLGSGPPS